MADTRDALLFDDFQRNDDGEPRTSEDAYSYLNRLAGEQGSRIRSMLENWFAAYNADDKEKRRLRDSFMNKDPGAHLAAWWELYTYSLYRCLGYSIEVHPEIVGVDTTPDFLVTRGADSMYVECTVVSALDGPVTRRPAVEAMICDAIKEIPNDDWLIGVTFETEGNRPPRRTEIQTKIGEWLTQHNPDTVRRNIEAAIASGELVAVLPKQNFAFQDWVLTCIAYPRPPNEVEGSKWLGALPKSRRYVYRNTAIIRKALRAKGGNYGSPGSLDKPLVVAVMSVNRIAAVADAVDAMFGSRTRDQGRRDAYWRGPDSAGGARGTRVSAILFSHDMQPWSVRSHLPIALINPWADNRINDHPPLSTITATRTGEIVETPRATTPQEVFGPDI